MQKTILVTGGCGYIGSHIVRQLSEAGYRIVVYDNLSTGFTENLINEETLIIGDLSDTYKLNATFKHHSIDAVIHLAASIVVSDSVSAPLDYYYNNTVNTLNLLKACQDFDVHRLVFSSTAAVYGDQPSGIAVEDGLPSPTSPYGRSKLFDEWMIRDQAATEKLNYVILRYFNVAGSDPKGRMGQRCRGGTHLIKVCCEAALGHRECVEIYGDDYDTQDGTGIRDYIHVEDLASAHISALEHLLNEGSSQVMNCGYGHGYSVKEVIACFNQVLQKPLNIKITKRRQGDLGMVISNNKKIRTTLQWKPNYDSLEAIVLSALHWEIMMAQDKKKIPQPLLKRDMSLHLTGPDTSQR